MTTKKHRYYNRYIVILQYYKLDIIEKKIGGHKI